MIADLPIEIWACHIATARPAAFNVLRRTCRAIETATRHLIPAAKVAWLVKEIRNVNQYRHVYMTLPNGAKHGRYEIIHLETAQVCEYRHYDNDKLHGEFYWCSTYDREWWRSEYRHGIHHGPYKQYSTRRKLGWCYTERNYIDDHRCGIETVRYPNGRLIMATQYDQGIRHGLRVKFKGSLCSMSKYEYGYFKSREKRLIEDRDNDIITRYRGEDIFKYFVF